MTAPDPALLAALAAAPGIEPDQSQVGKVGVIVARITLWADGHISAAHIGPDGVLHGHTWRVRAWWMFDGQDAIDMRARLAAALSVLDHTALPAWLARAEALAEHIADQVDASRCDVWREPEGLGASWSR